MRNKHGIKDRIGEIFESNNYGKFKVVEYTSSKDIRIEFLYSGFVKSVSSRDIIKGCVKDPYFPSVSGVGFIGEGNYRMSYFREGKKFNTPAYEVWLGKLKTCSGKGKSAHLYTQTAVCDEWLNFQVFAEWFYKQVKIYGKGGHVDKDLAYLGNKDYNPITARYVPAAINSLFTGKSGGKISGVSFSKDKNGYVAQLQKGELTAKGSKKQSYLGTFKSYEEARTAYVDAKIQHVKETVLLHQNKIPPDLFYKLYNGAWNYVNYYTTDQGVL